jgi:DNA-binding LacI/PurR family transcriptional regulator
VNVKEIAALAGVSAGTVDRVIYHRGRVSVETKKRIEAIIEQYQFTPNPIARRLKRNRAYRFCAFLPRRDQDAGYWGQVLEGIEEGAKSPRMRASMAACSASMVTIALFPGFKPRSRIASPNRPNSQATWRR